MDERAWNKIFAVCGLVFVALTIVLIVVSGNSPSSDSSTAAITSYFSGSRMQVFVADHLGGLSIVFGAFFMGGLWRLLRRAEGGDGVLSLVAFGTFYLTGALILAASVGDFTLAYHTAAQGDQNLTRALFDLTSFAFNVANFTLATTLIAAGIVMLQTGVLARWLGWLALAAAAAQLVQAASFADSGAFMPSGGLASTISGALFGIWVLATCITMRVRTPRGARLAAGAAPA